MIWHEDKRAAYVDGEGYVFVTANIHRADLGIYDADENTMAVYGGCCASESMSVAEAEDLIELLSMYIADNKK